MFFLAILIYFCLQVAEQYCEKWGTVANRLKMSEMLVLLLKAETHDKTNRCDTSPRQVATTNRLVWHVKIIAAATEFSRYDLSQEFKLVWIRATYRSDKISASSLVAPCVCISDKSLRQNLNQPMGKHQLVSRHVKFEVVYISSLPKSITCTEQVSYRSDLSQDQCRRGDLSPRCVASCVSAFRGASIN